MECVYLVVLLVAVQTRTPDFEETTARRRDDEVFVVLIVSAV
jgi:hypothetical protein